MSAPDRGLAWIVGVSLVLRLAAYLWVLGAEVPLLFDEQGYFDRAVAWHDLFVGWVQGEGWSQDAWAQAYGLGHWPPLHSMLLAVVFLVGGPSVALARGVPVVLSVLTTLWVYRVGRRLVGEPGARAGAWLHAVYPTFIVYSHLLWAETTYCFLLLVTVGATLRALGAPAESTRLQSATWAGLGLGLTALTKAAALPYLLAVPVWLGIRLRRRSQVSVAPWVLLAVALSTIFPWQMALFEAEQRPVALSTLGGFNLALGNNPWVPPGLGSSWGHETSKAQLMEALRDDAARQSVDGPPVPWEAVAMPFAWRVIVDEPWTFAVRGLERLRMLWAPDFFPLRHLFKAVYPPLAPKLVGVLAMVGVTSYFVLTALILWGLFDRRLSRPLGLVVLLVVVGMALPAVSIGMSRLHMPLLVLLLPIAGRSLIYRWRGRPFPRRTFRALLLFVGIVLSGLGGVVRLHLVPSSHYAAVLDPVARALGQRMVYSDRLELRRTAACRGLLTLGLAGPTTRFHDGSRTFLWRPAAPSLKLDVFSETDSPELVVESPYLQTPQRLRPVEPGAWRTWRSLGVSGCTVRWTGGGRSPH